MKSSTGMFEIAIFLGLVGVCLTVAFTALHHTRRDIVEMEGNIQDVRQIQDIYSGNVQYNYLNRPGAYLDAVRLSFSAGTASADSRANIRIFDLEIEPYDMYTMNISATSDKTPVIYKALSDWWDGFSASSEYSCAQGVSCTGPLTCPDASTHSYVFTSGVDTRTFDPSHILPSLAGYEMSNPSSLDEAKFKLRVVEVGQDATEGTAILEYRVYIFLGSLVKQTATSAPQLEYRWYECVKGSATEPWVVLQ